jgi:hypothetical protein
MTETTTRQIIQFETTECSRCGGTGHYSYNAMDGTICYGCSGRKTQMTRKGAAAFKAYEAAKATVSNRPVYTARVGDRIYATGAKIGSPRRWRTVRDLRTRVDGLGQIIVIADLAGPTSIQYPAGAVVMVHPGNDVIRGIMADIAGRFSGATIVEQEVAA